MESTLADAYRDLIGSLGFEAGYGRGPDNGDREWSDRKLTTLRSVVKSGLRQFYGAHEWSFLHPRARLTLDSGSKEMRLPFDFEGCEGPLSLIASSGGTDGRVQVTNDVRARYARFPDATGRPAFAEKEPIKGTTKDRGQRWQFVFFPEPTAAYTIEFTYKISGDMLSGDLPYAYGGAEHSETILASCLAIWESRIDDIPPGPAAPRYAHWREQLALSVRRDQNKRPDTLGYNGDRSDNYDRRSGGRYPRDFGWPDLTLNGVTYD